MIAAADIREFCRSPDWLLAGIDIANRQCSFANVSRQTYLDSPFLDHRIRPMPSVVRSAPAGRLVEELAGTEAEFPPGFIIHCAFAGSTLLASALNHPGLALVLKEPRILSVLAGHIRQARSAGRNAAAFDDSMADLVLSLLNKTYAADERLIIKPSNYANVLLDYLPDRYPASPLLLLYTDAKRFLVSNLKKERESRKMLPVFLAALWQDSDYAESAGLPDWQALTWLQQCFVLWHCQLYRFMRFCQPRPGQRIGLLSMKQMLDRPQDALTAVARLFGLSMDGELIRTVVEHGVFTRHSKESDRNYSPRQHDLELAAIETQFAGRIEQTMDWAQTSLARIPVQFDRKYCLLD